MKFILVWLAWGRGEQAIKPDNSNSKYFKKKKLLFFFYFLILFINVKFEIFKKVVKLEKIFHLASMRNSRPSRLYQNKKQKRKTGLFSIENFARVLFNQAIVKAVYIKPQLQIFNNLFAKSLLRYALLFLRDHNKHSM